MCNPQGCAPSCPHCSFGSPNGKSSGGVSSGQGGPFADKYSYRVPLRRMATVDDLVGPVAFLLSEASSYITGQTIVIDGGGLITLSGAGARRI